MKAKVGDRVELKGIQFGGHTGTVVRTKRPVITWGLMKLYFVRLDGTWLGHSVVKVTKGNIRTRMDEP
jgi:hypothetical protein